MWHRAPIRFLVFVLRVAAFGLCVSTPALSAPNETRAKGPNTEGDPTLEEANRLRAMGDRENALRAYRDAQTKMDSPICQRNIAELEDELGHFGMAYSEYAKLLDRFAAQLKPAQKKRALKRLGELDKLTGVLLLEPLYPNAVVRIDAQVIPETLLSQPIRALRGERQITIEQPSYKPVQLVQTVGPVLTRVTVPLEPVTVVSEVHISASSNDELILSVDGTIMGPLPQRLELARGEHELSADGPLASVRPRKILVTDGSAQTIVFEAERKRAQLEIDTVAPDAVLFVDGQQVGVGPQKLELLPGPHVLELQRAGFVKQTLNYNANPNDRYTLRAAAYQPVRVEHRDTQKKREAPQAKTTTVSKAKSAPPSSPFRGFNVAFTVPVLLAGKSTHSYAVNCPATAYSGACNTTAPRGAALALRIGYFYEWLGLEVLGGGALDYSSAEMKLPPIRSVTPQMQKLAERNSFVRAGAFIGGGLRISTPTYGIRVTAGGSLVYIPRKVLSVPDSFLGGSLNYTAHGYIFDGGIELGSTPNSRLYLGAFLMIEQGHDLVVHRDLAALGIAAQSVPETLTQFSVYRGNQYFFGPMIGIAYGH